MVKTWFTADTHLTQERTLKLSKRPFNSVQEMDEEIIDRWNSKVRQGDTVYHQGDFGDYSYIKYLNGNIILLLGNYERNDIDKGLITIPKLYSIGFTEVIEETSVIREIEGHKFELVHEPLNATKVEFTLFGHIHKSQMVKPFGLNVGVDCHNFYPIDMEDILYYQTAVNKYYDENVFMK